MAKELISFHIPNGNIDALESYIRCLDNYPDKIDPEEIESVLANALVYKNNIMISLLNNFIREHNVKTTKRGISEAVRFSKPKCEDRYLLHLILGHLSGDSMTDYYPFTTI